VTAGRRIALAAAVLAAPVAWASQLVAAYALEQGGCSVGGHEVAGAEVDAALRVASLAALAVALAGGATALLLLRRRDADADSARAARFVADGAASAAVVFAILIVLGGVASVVLDPCSAG
jgi:hypothetical protein